MDQDILTRCGWVPVDNELYAKYHDEEWGIPVHDDRKHFEFLILEGAQAGLSWLTVLKRREAYREAFADFDPRIVAEFTEEDIQGLLQNEGIIRNKLKVRSAVSNAKLFLAIQAEFGSFDGYIWDFVGGKTIVNRPSSLDDFQATSAESDALSEDLKRRGFKFTGSTIMYAHMQACGLVDDHQVGCFRCQK